MADEKMIDKINKLLAKANNTAVTQEEAEAFNRKAHELMTQYNIDRATLEASKPKEQRSAGVRKHMTLTVKVRPWSSSILHGLTKLYYCRWFFTGDVVTLIGEEQNVAVCHAIAVMVLRAVQQEARRNYGGRSFMTGAGHIIYQRCYDMYNEVHGSNALTAQTKQITAAQSNALVVLSTNEQAENALYLQNVLRINLRPSKSTGAKINSGAAYHAGAAYGRNVQLRANLLK